MPSAPPPHPILSRAGTALLLVTVVAVALVLAVTAPLRAGATAVNPPQATVPPAKSSAVFFVPHADDDVLSMGVYLNELVRLGVDVHVVYYTDGAGTGVCSPKVVTVPVDDAHPNGTEEQCTANWPSFPAAENWHGQPVTNFITARDAEFRKSVEALGVKPDNIDVYTPETGRRRDGTVDVAFAHDMLLHYRPLFPDSTFVTMSWLDDHPDHGSAGRALRALVASDPAQFPADDAVFTLARWYWPYNYPNRVAGLSQAANALRASQGYPLADSLERCLDPKCTAAIDDALHAYQQPTDIGYRSVPDYLDVTAQDPAVLLHGVGAGRYAGSAAVRTLTRSPAGSATLAVSGALTVVPRPDTTYPVSQNNPDGLAQGFNPQPVPYPSAPITLQALSATGAVVGTGTATVGHNTFSGTVHAPAGATSVVVSVGQTQGTAAVKVTVPVQTQSETVAAQRGVSLSAGRLSAGYGQPITVSATVRRAGRGVSGSTVVFAPTAGKPVVAKTAALVRAARARTSSAGVALLHLTLPTSGTAVVSATSPTAGVAPGAGDTLRLAVRPAALSVLPHARTVTATGTHVRVTGTLAGRDYAIASSFLLPATVTAWITLRGRRTVLGTFHSRVGGAFSVSLPVRGAGRVHFDVAASPGVYAPRASAGSLTVLR